MSEIAVREGMIKYINFVFILFLSNFLIACDFNDEKGFDTRDAIYSERKIDELLAKSLRNGDCEAFQNAVVNRHLADDGYSIFYYTQIMANKYNCPIAYYYLGVDMNADEGTYIGGIPVWSDDELTRNMAIYNLLKAYELGYEPSKYELEVFLGDDPKKFPKSSDFIVFLKVKNK
ncbi:hypothetical protein [Acinetobacter sp. Ac_5812]|uniref:hypothetical protein n=1 Tax=Acinetobacter sp. Ac_5812 TaxID=1848937 RepID=UPI0014905F65|nr:hypothetical protein [Acinetobacter sp. Ac_5812]NNP71083.1 hypothetical protein [Acinetobacter sp. Ac_5812]